MLWNSVTQHHMNSMDKIQYNIGMKMQTITNNIDTKCKEIQMQTRSNNIGMKMQTITNKIQTIYSTV